MIMINNQPNKTTPKTILKTAKATGDLIGKKSTSKITKVLKNLPQKTLETVESKIEAPREIYISSEERQKITDGGRLI